MITLTITPKQAADIRDALQIAAIKRARKTKADADYADALDDLAFQIDDLRRAAERSTAVKTQ